MADALPYTTISVVPVTEWDEGTQTSVAGKRVKALWIATQDIVSVFVPNTADFAPAADQLIRAQGAQYNKLYGVKE